MEAFITNAEQPNALLGVLTEDKVKKDVVSLTKTNIHSSSDVCLPFFLFFQEGYYLRCYLFGSTT